MEKIIPKILIVDDYEETLIALGKILASKDFSLITSQSPREALEIAKQNELALVILDVKMPEMDGFQLAKELQKIEHLRTVPYFFLTSSSNESENISKGYVVGAVDYMLKPADPYILKSKVKVFSDLFLEKKRHEEKAQKLQEANLLLDLAKKDAESSNIAKSELLRMIVHDLRTPLTVIEGNAQLLTEKEFMPEEDEIIEIATDITEAGDQLKVLLNDLSDFAKLDLQTVRLDQIDLFSGEIIDLVRNEFSAIASEQKIEFELSEHDNFSVNVDLKYLKKAFAEIFMNALESTKEGKISFSVKLEDELGFFEFTDTGSGIKPENIEKIFDPFVSFQTQVNSKKRGLGLTKAKKIVQLHRGKISVESTPGKGSSFKIALPLSKTN